MAGDKCIHEGVQGGVYLEKGVGGKKGGMYF